jgi:hypothetical protein
VKGNRSDGKKFIPSDNNGAWRLDSSAAYDLEATEATTGLNAIRRPDTKTSCCNLTDCRPTSGRQVDDHYEVKINGAWISVPADKILKKSAPDLGFHVCAPFNFTASRSRFTASSSRRKSRRRGGWANRNVVHQE